MKNILKYLLLCCSALSLFGCEDYLDKTPQGDKTEEDVFTRFNETEQLINLSLSGLRSIRTSAVQTSFSKVSRNTTRPTRRYTPERCRSVSARSISCAPTCTTAC